MLVDFKLRYFVIPCCYQRVSLEEVKEYVAKQYNIVVSRDIESIIALVVHKFQKVRVGKIGC